MKNEGAKKTQSLGNWTSRLTPNAQKAEKTNKSFLFA